ncbi:PaaI family thioesterase [Amycolatopsis minnesotensis]|uniref:Thioesterase domain-containing protein n=1 Tax=Amycolatopsis minnesotensis TaxID=337894 RepID=A0ABN2R6M8_9PSEU
MSTALIRAGEPIELPWLDEPEFRCFGCSPENPIGLALAMLRLPDGRIGAEATFGEYHTSYPGVVHGGLVHVLVDEVMGDALAIEHGLLAFSVTLRTKMLLPLRVGVPYLAAARIARAAGGLFHTEADVLGPDGEVHVMASAAYRPIRSAQARDLMGLDDSGYARTRHYFDHEIGP